MPYAPSVNFDASPLYQGFASIGNSLETARESKRLEQLRRDQLAQQSDQDRIANARALQFHQDSLTQQANEMVGRMADSSADRDLRLQMHNEQMAVKGSPLMPPATMQVPGGLVVDLGNGKREFHPAAAAKPPSDADVSFDTNLSSAKTGLDQLEETINRSGTWESRFGNPEDAARLGSLPYTLAIQTAKILDPASVAREGEVDAAKKYVIPIGIMTDKKTALAALANHRKLLGDYEAKRAKAQGGVRASAPPATPPASAPSGYQVGKRYGGMTYLGGNPNDATSWR